nr:uncharacterized protein LOC105330431 [Crassostrea gigas]XP_034304942.1 uncharacterized protein LOC105330431 [Crassostrea gigas]XP_034304948.1 uncharacterized protein LOC105330431 [Crassostrea gigas]XP_034304950.1 uncharacterized protein LOC105330431 [Crassostrea gigas]
MSFDRHPFWNGPPDLMFVHMQDQVFHHKKQTALRALNGNQLQQALELYTEALQIAQTLPHLFSEIPKILSNRSLVYYRQGKFQLAIYEANHSINVNRLWIKGYWRAAKAHKELGQVDFALDAAIGGYNVSVNQNQEEEIISFLVEIVSIIITLRHDPKNLLENSEILTGSIQTQRKLLQRLASNNCWEGVSLLVMGVHAGPPSTLDASAASCPVDGLSVGNLLNNITITELKRFGVDLAICLLRSGASYEDIEQKMEKPVIHVGLKVALDTGNISLIKLMFSQYLKTPETKDALDGEGRTGLHVIVHSGKNKDSIRETLFRLLINNGCQSSIPDWNCKLAIDYLTPNDLGFNILSTTTKVADSHVKVKINEIKEKGNMAFKNKKFNEALIFYNKAITMVKGYKNLTHEAAVVLTNRSIVHTSLHSVTEALRDAEEAVRFDQTWLKGHWKRGQLLRQKKLFRESFSAFLEGYWKGDGTVSEKYNILVEVVASFSNITEKQELEANYKSLSKVSNEAWPEVMTKLSVRGEWAAIRYVVLGVDFKYINGQVTPSGVARDADLQGITYSTLFQYLESHEDPASLNDWITPLMSFLITQRGDPGTLLRFRASEEDMPLSAVVRFCVLTGDIALLQNMPYRPEMVEFVDGRGDSPFHALFKMSHFPQGKLLASIVRLLLQKGVSPTVRDRSQLLPIDYVNPSNNKEVHDILKKYTQQEQRLKQGQEQEKQRQEKLRQQEERQRQKEEKREEGERKGKKSEEAVRGQHRRNKRQTDKTRKKEQTYTLAYCNSKIKDATQFLLDKNMTQAYLSLAEVLKKVHMSEEHKELQQQALDIVITSLGKSPYQKIEIPNELVKIPHELYKQLIHGLAAKERWIHMYFAIKEHRLHHGDLSLPNFAKSMPLTKVIKHSSFKDSEQLLIDVVKCMLNGGAVLDEDGKQAIFAAVKESKFKVLEVLFNQGANPDHLTINQGDTPIHAALTIGLERNKGNFSILKYFFDLFENDPDKYPMLDPAQTNSDGDTLFHLVAKAKYSSTTKKLAKFLCDKKLNALVFNKERKLPRHYLNSKDDKRLQFLVRKDVVKKHIKDMIISLPNISHSFFNTKVAEMDEISNFQQKKKATEEKDISKMDQQVFDNLKWEVECTADVWKTLRDKKVPPELKQKIIKKIQLLAKGEWTPHLCKELRNTPSTIKLYEVKLSKASRIIWELATAFSPRLSEDAEQRLQYAEDEADQPIRGGRIYSEVIRVWDIVFDHDKIYKSVQRIIKSHSRGEKCIIQRKLKGVKQKQFKGGRSERIPMLFAESDLDADVNSLEFLQSYYPPASSNETEYHILKFYNFDSNLVNDILQNLEVRVDFPFRVTHLEHSIINLTTNAPILMLGRSGTGKTTCCMYRLWSKFVSYWTGAVAADSKLIPRCQIFHQKNDVVDIIEESEKGTSEEDEEAEYKEEGEEDQTYDHLHQIFITKNVVLCSEVQKNFKEMSNACDVVRHFVSQKEQPLPHRIQDIGDNQFPVFITSKKLLLMLDASLKGPCFFERNDDGSLKVEIQGWAEPDGAFNFLSMLYAESDDEDEEDEDNQHQYADDSEDDHNDKDTQNRPPKKVDPRREVTYKVFAEEVWPLISKKCSGQYHPSLIWTEIMSFIKGSFEAISKPSGYLSKEEYFDMGRKRAPNFSGERENIYEMFKKYDHFKRQKLLFDEIDLVKNVFNRLKKEKKVKWIIHQIYVDETQDFTQAELCLLIRMCHSPNEMFLTGDTAQSIMRGISFRFEDLSSLFFYAKRSTHAIGKSSGVIVPNKVYQLTHNYRSHTGILSLASSILDLMVEFFPESFDRLKKDRGLFEGPRPVILESCSFSDLAVLLRGHNRKAPHIDFGTHQAILVVNEAARDNIPKELNHGVILTIYEAKGLEFDDILLYNFFKDSQATKEWRIVTEFLEKLAATNEQSSIHSSESLVSINADVLKLGDRPRPLAFDPNQHKVLNSELKQLYTAITRARVNVWIFDEDPDKRAPMFEYFKARELTRNITVAELKNVSAKGVFAEQSSTEQWLQKGEEFMKQSLYEVAAKCFNRGENYRMEKIAKAHHLASLASRMRDTPEDMNEVFLMAAEKFLECKQPNKAAICLQNAREKELVAHLYENLNQLEKAGKTYHKLKRPKDESRCYEQIGKFNLAVETLVENGLFEMAIDTLWRYKTLRGELDQQLTTPSRILIENAPSHEYTVESLSYMAAEAYHRSKNKEKMMAALERLPDLRARTDFLIRKNYIEEAAQLLKKAEIKPKLEDIMSSFEDSVNEESMREPESAREKLGLMLDDSVDGETFFRSIAKKFCNGCDQLVKGNPCEALMQFTKFCALLSNTGSAEVIPHYNQLLLWMEYYTTVAFCLTAKVQNTPNFFLVIPESYIAVVYSLDATFIQEKGDPTFEAVQKHMISKDDKDTSLFQERLEKLVDIVCVSTSNSKVNLLSHIFQFLKTEQSIAHEVCGVAERLLVLALVFVCNIGKSVSMDVETKLVSELCKIKIWKKYPSRLSEALKSVQKAESPVDVANALRILLLKRENDSLACYSWDNSNNGCGLQKKELRTTELFKESFFKDKTFKALQNPSEELSSEVNRDMKEDNEVGSTFSKEEEHMEIEAEKSEMENEVHNLSYCVTRKISKEKQDEKINVFESIQITNTGCGVCGVRFKESTTDFVCPMNRQTFNEFEPSGLLQNPSSLQLSQPNYERVQLIQTNPGPGVVADNLPTFKSEILLEDAKEETRGEHEQSEKHKEMVKFYQHFRLKYMQEISDPFREVRDFIQRYKLGSAELVEKHFKEETYNIGILCRQQESVEIKIESIIKECDWQNGEIWGEVQEMIGSHNWIKDYVETEARKRKERSETRGGADSDKDSQQILDDDMEAIEPVVYEPKERRRKGTKKKKGRRR